MMSLNLVLKIILNQYFLSTRCLFLISEDGCSKVQFPLGYSVVSVTVDSKETVQTISGKLFHNFGCQVFIFDVKKPAWLTSIVERGLKNQNETFSDRKYIVIANNENSDNLTSALLGIKEIRFIYDLLIISLVKSKSIGTGFHKRFDEVYYFWTYKYTGVESQLTAEFIDAWFSLNHSFLLNNNLFPDKIVSSFGKVYKIGFFTYLPYIYDGGRKNNKTILDGVEGLIINGFFNKYNLSFEPILIEAGYWGDVFDNGSSYGLKGVVYEENADIGVAACFATERLSRYFGMTNTILRIGVSCLMPAPELLPGWMTPIKPFSKLLWTSIIMAYIFIVLSVYTLQLMLSHSTACADLRHQNNIGLEGILLTTFGQQTKNNLKGCFLRIFSLLTLFTTLILCRSYESGLASILTIPSYRSSIETVNDFLNSNISWGGINIADWLMHWKNDEEESYRRAYNRYIPTTSSEILESLMNAGNFAPSFERILSTEFHFPFRLKENTKSKLMKEDIHWDYSVFILRKSAPITPFLNKYILDLQQSGLLNHWLNTASTKFATLRELRSLKYRLQHGTAEYSTRVKIGLSHMAGVFGILIVGNCFALFVFLAELIFCSSEFHRRHRRESIQ